MDNVLHKDFNIEIKEQDNFCLVPLDNFDMAAFSTKCGLSNFADFDVFNTKVIRFCRGAVDSVAEVVSKFLPKGLGVMIAADYGAKDLAKYVERLLNKAGFKAEISLIEDASTDCALKLKPKAGFRAVLGVGSYNTANLSRYVGGAYSLPTILIPSDPDILEFMSPYSPLLKNGFKEFYRTPPPSAVIVDLDAFTFNCSKFHLDDNDQTSHDISFGNAAKAPSDKSLVMNNELKFVDGSINIFKAKKCETINADGVNSFNGMTYDCDKSSHGKTDKLESCEYIDKQNTSLKMLKNANNLSSNQYDASVNLASAFGNVMSVYFALFDWRFSSLITDEKYSDYAVVSAKEIITKLLEALERGVTDRKIVSELIVDSSLRLSILMQATDNTRYIHGGAAQAESCLSALERFEQRRSKRRGESRFIWSGILTEVYLRKLADDRRSFVPPPDNNRRMDAMKEFFGLNEFAAAKKITPYISATTLKLYQYKIAEYREDLMRELTETEAVLRRAQKIFKRLYDDDGYSLVGYPQREDAALILALAPDFGGKPTYLTYLKQCGILDLYLN